MRLPHLEPKAHVGVEREVRFRPYLIPPLCARNLLPTRGGARLRRLSLRRESDGIKGLQQTDDHERYLVVCKLRHWKVSEVVHILKKCMQ